MADTIGMMNNAYFISRNEVLKWINNTLDLNLQKIEELGSGAVYCQLFDAVYPKKISLKKVKWTAKQEYEYVHNYKLLQDAFVKTGHKKHIEVEKLIKGRYQDNLEFAQWFKAFYDHHAGGRDDYDPVARRGAVNLEGLFGSGAGRVSAGDAVSKKKVFKLNSSSQVVPKDESNRQAQGTRKISSIPSHNVSKNIARSSTTGGKDDPRMDKILKIVSSLKLTDSEIVAELRELLNIQIHQEEEEAVDQKLVADEEENHVSHMDEEKLHSQDDQHIGDEIDLMGEDDEEFDPND